VSVHVCAESLRDARSTNTACLWILCRHEARVYVPAGLHLLSGYHVPNRPVGIHIPAAIYHEEVLYRGKSGNIF